MVFLKKLIAQLPNQWEAEMKRVHFRRQIKKNRFLTTEPEYLQLDKFVRLGDWVIDIGANIGHYTKRLSDLVGIDGRVIAVEPVPTTFSLLAANSELFANRNVSLINAAASDRFATATVSIPNFSTGLANYYQATLSSGRATGPSVLTLPLDCLHIPHRVALVKIDTEGHESYVLDGMQRIIEASHPVLIIETASHDIIERVSSLGYIPERLDGSPNVLFRPKY